MIAIENLCKSFGRQEVLRNIQLELSSNESYAMIGPNGCGKTTLIKSLLGMVIPTSGNIFFKEKSITNQFAYRKCIGYMPQIGHYPDNMTIGHIVDMMKEIRNTGKPLDEDLLHAFELQKIFHKRMRTLSGGTTQKVSATLAFLFNPEVLILDEPTAGLDPMSAEILKEKIILEKKRGKLILITSHILSELDDLITGIIYIEDGQILLKHTVEAIQEITNEHKVSKGIAQLLKLHRNAQNH